jgi:hypothetical protein
LIGISSIPAVKNAVRTLIPALLGTVLLAVSACDDGGTPSPPAGDPSAGIRWTGFAKDCPAFAGADPGKRSPAAYDGANLFSLRCQYQAAGQPPAIVLNVTVYRAASGGSTAEQLAVDTLEKDRTAPAGTATPAPSEAPGGGPAAPSAAPTVEPVDGLGDSAFARLVPARGVRVYVRSANALIQLDYTDPGDSRKALTTATELTRQALTALV